MGSWFPDQIDTMKTMGNARCAPRPRSPWAVIFLQAALRLKTKKLENPWREVDTAVETEGWLLTGRGRSGRRECR
jgi:hypothetical protein